MGVWKRSHAPTPHLLRRHIQLKLPMEHQAHRLSATAAAAACTAGAPAALHRALQLRRHRRGTRRQQAGRAAWRGPLGRRLLVCGGTGPGLGLGGL